MDAAIEAEEGAPHPASPKLALASSCATLSHTDGERVVVALHQARLLDGSGDEGGEQRVRVERLRLQLRMELHADEPGV